MRNKKFSIYTLTLILFVLGFGANQVSAQPTDAQLKKQLWNPKTVSITFTTRGAVEWSKTYKKYVWSRYFSAKEKTETPGEFRIVRGYASYDVMGGRYVFWRTFISDHSFEGKKNLTVAEINKALETARLRDFNLNDTVIGEYETMKLAAEPDWEWNTQNSVSFNVVAVFRIDISGGRRYRDTPWYNAPAGFKAVDRVEAYLRISLSRDGANLPWRVGHVSDRIPTSRGAQTIDQRIRLLERKEYPEAEFRRMPRMTKAPLLTQ